MKNESLPARARIDPESCSTLIQRLRSLLQELSRLDQISDFSVEQRQQRGCVLEQIQSVLNGIDSSELSRWQATVAEQTELISNAQIIGRMGSWHMDVRSGILYWPEATCKLFGIKPSEFKGTFEHFRSFILEEDIPGYEAKHAAIQPAQPFLEAEYRIRRPDGTVRWMSERGKVEFDVNGAVLSRVGMVMDVTEQRLALEKVEQSEAVLKTAGKVARLGGWTIELPERKLHWSDENCLIHEVPPGYQPTLDEGISLFPPEYREMVRRHVDACAKEGKAYDFECPKHTRKGRLIWVRCIGEAVRDSDGKIVRLQGAFQDITERKQAEQALRASEERVRTTFNTAAAGIFIAEANGRFLLANPAFCRTLGYTETEMQALDFTQITHSDDLPCCLAAVNDLVSGKKREVTMEKRYLRKDGVPVWVRANIAAVVESDRTPPRIIAVTEDITEQRSVREEIERSQALLRIAGKIARLGGWSIELPEQKLHWSDEICAIHDLPPGHVPTLQEAIEFYLPGSRETVRSIVFDCVEKGVPFDFEMEIITAKERRAWVRATGEAVRDGLGKIVRVQGAFQDISEQKNAELELHRAARRLEKTLESITDAFFTLDRQWRFTYINAEAEHLLSRSRTELLGRVVWEEFPEAVGSAFEREYRRAFAEDVTVRFEEFYPPLNTWFEVRAFPSREGIAVYFQDVSERKKAALALARSNRALQLLSRCNEALIRSQSESELLSAVCRIAVEIGGYRLAWIGYAENDEYKTVVPRAHAGDGKDYLSKVRITWSAEDPFGQGPCGRTIRGGKPVVVPDLELEESFGLWREPARRSGFRGMVCLPLKDSHGPFGVLALYLPELRTIAADELALLQELADDVAFGILNHRIRFESRVAQEKIAQQAELLDKARDAIIVRDLEHRIQYWNKSAERLYGWTAAEAIGQSAKELFYRNPAIFQGATEATLSLGEWTGELEQLTKDKKPLQIEGRWTLVRNDEGNPKSILAINTDISEKKKIEAQFLRTQRMESIGTLAGGIAHDLNNVLAPILMSLEILKLTSPDEESKKLLVTLQNSARRGAELVQQVLSFARGVEGKRIVVNPRHLMRELIKVMQDTLPKSVAVRFKPAQDLWTVNGDPTQLHQVFLNLCVNARDAMPSGGELSIVMENLVLDDTYAAMNPDSKAGAYVVVEVADTGLGIPRDIQDRIFEPFFTTKEVGKGTGLGLSTTMAIVKSHGGFIHLYSEPGKGAKFKVCLPANTTEVASDKVAVEQTLLPRGNGELILVVDDEESIRRIAQKTLERFGYRVVLACNGAEAVSIYAQNPGAISAVLTDMAMPIMDGVALIVALKSMDPHVRIIASSGLTNNGEIAKTVGTGVEHFVSKPYTAEALLNLLSKVIAKGDA